MPEPIALRRYDDSTGPELIGPMWTLAKGTWRAFCTLSTHSLGWELRVTLGENFIRSQVCKSQDAVHELSDAWRKDWEAKGWIPA